MFCGVVEALCEKLKCPPKAQEVCPPRGNVEGGKVTGRKIIVIIKNIPEFD